MNKKCRVAPVELENNVLEEQQGNPSNNPSVEPSVHARTVLRGVSYTIGRPDIIEYGYQVHPVMTLKTSTS